ncbi:MAG: anthranilate phosphoribosyltransferase, partial [Terriglobales bacterium]
MTSPSAPEALTAALRRVMAGEDLARDVARQALDAMLAGEAEPMQIAGLLVALATKGETVDEIVGFAEAMRAAATLIAAPAAVTVSGTGHDALAEAPGSPSPRLVDTCGTGGDASGTFNISTATALVAAGAGLRIAKHGNRSLSSQCGSADVMEALGVKIDLPPARLAACLERTGFAFLYAPALHPAMRHVQPVRRALRVRTIFNLLGPLTNPAGAGGQVVGVYARAWVGKLAEALRALGAGHAFVVHGEDGLDEVSTTAPTAIAELRDGRVREYVLRAADLGLPPARLADLQGGDAAANAALIRAVLAGEPGPRRDIVALNAAAALLAGGLAGDWPAALARAQAALDSG